MSGDSTIVDKASILAAAAVMDGIGVLAATCSSTISFTPSPSRRGVVGSHINTENDNGVVSTQRGCFSLLGASDMTLDASARAGDFPGVAAGVAMAVEDLESGVVSPEQARTLDPSTQGLLSVEAAFRHIAL